MTLKTEMLVLDQVRAGINNLISCLNHCCLKDNFMEENIINPYYQYLTH